MQQTPNQIFTLKSNLITQYKGVSLNLNQYKNTQHTRLKSVCFSNVLKTIRNDVARFRHQDREEAQGKGKGQGRDKENGMIIQACNFMAVYGNQGVTGAKAKGSIVHSRSFLIRSFNQKKPEKPMSSEKKQKQDKLPSKLPSSTFHFSLRSYNLHSASELKRKVTIKQRKYPRTLNPALTLLIPIEIMQKGAINTEALKQLLQKNIDVCVIGARDLCEKERSFEEYCHFLSVKGEGGGNRELVLNFSSEMIGEFGEKLLILYGDDRTLYVPCCQASDQPFYEQDHNLKLAFLKLNSTILIRDINVVDDRLQVEVGQAQGHQNRGWKMKLMERVYPLRRQIKLQLEIENRHRPTSKLSSSVSLPIPQLDQIQQKLLQYSKILKREQSSAQKPNPSHSQQPKQKQARRSLTSKSPYQVIYELIKNNGNTHRQINAFIQEAKYQNFQSIEEVECDDLVYYVIQ